MRPVIPISLLVSHKKSNYARERHTFIEEVNFDKYSRRKYLVRELFKSQRAVFRISAQRAKNLRSATCPQQSRTVSWQLGIYRRGEVASASCNRAHGRAFKLDVSDIRTRVLALNYYVIHTENHSALL